MQTTDMALTVDVDVDIDANLSGKTMRGVRRYLEDGAQKGHGVAMSHVPVDKATLRTQLSQGDPVMTTAGGSPRVVWGVTDVDYARAMEFGTEPFTPPIEPLLEWGERVIGSRDAGAAVWHKIREEGIDAQPYIRPGIEAQKRFYQSHDAAEYVERELR